MCVAKPSRARMLNDANRAEFVEYNVAAAAPHKISQKKLVFTTLAKANVRARDNRQTLDTKFI